MQQWQNQKQQYSVLHNMHYVSATERKTQTEIFAIGPKHRFSYKLIERFYRTVIKSMGPGFRLSGFRFYLVKLCYLEKITLPQCVSVSSSVRC